MTVEYAEAAPVPIVIARSAATKQSRLLVPLLHRFAVARDGGHQGLQNRLRAKTNFSRPIKLICPVQSIREKYLPSIFPKFMFVYRYPASIEEGRFAVVTSVGGGERWPVGAQRALSRADERDRQDGEVVWSWRPDAGVKSATMREHRADDGGYKPGHRGEYV